MKIKFIVTSPMRYFWLKQVNGVQLTKHCAGCLVGNYWPNVNGDTIEGEYCLPDGVYYLCGVSKPYNWSRNFHLAFVNDVDSKIRYENNGVIVEVDGARRLTFGIDDVDPNDPHYSIPEYRTCRNWQFAHWLVKHPDILK